MRLGGETVSYDERWSKPLSKLHANYLASSYSILGMIQSWIKILQLAKLLGPSFITKCEDIIVVSTEHSDKLVLEYYYNVFSLIVLLHILVEIVNEVSQEEHGLPRNSMRFWLVIGNRIGVKARGREHLVNKKQSIDKGYISSDKGNETSLWIRPYNRPLAPDAETRWIRI